MNMYKPCLYFSRNGIFFCFVSFFHGRGGGSITIGNLISPGGKGQTYASPPRSAQDMNTLILHSAFFYSTELKYMCNTKPGL